MAATYQSKTSYTGGFGDAAGTDITLPSGSTAGELVILFYAYYGNSSSNGVFDASSNAGSMPVLVAESEYADGGFTGSRFAGARYVFLNATDISNGDIHINGSDSFSEEAFVELYRFSGVTAINAVSVNQGGGGSNSPTYNISVTPVVSAGLLLMMVASAIGSGVSISGSGYAVTTNNPASWTELTDATQGGSGETHGIQTAYGTRSSINATGDATMNFTSGATVTSYAIMVSISGDIAASPAADVGVSSVVGPSTTTGPSGEMFSAHDSFNIGAISNGYSNVEFDIGITAVDVEDRRILNYTGTPTVSSTGTLSTGSGATVPFVAGELDDHAVKFSNTGSFTITVTDGSISGVSNSFDIYELTDIQNHKGDIFYPVKILPTLSNVRHINIIMAPVSGFSDNDLTLQEAAVKFYFNMSETPYCTKYVTRGDIKKGYVSFELNKQYVNSIQIEVEYFNEDNPRPSGGYSNHGVADFCPSYAEVIYERTDTIK